MNKEKTKDWKLGELYKNSWQIIKKHKVLWLFGMAVSASSASYSSRSSSDFSQKDLENFQKFFQPNNQTPQNDLSMVLGTATNAFFDGVGIIFTAIPAYLYLFLILELLFLFGTFVMIAIVYKSWAEAGLIEGIQVAISKGNVAIHETSEKAFRSILDIALVRIVPVFAFILAFIIFTFVSLFMGPIGPLFAAIGLIGFLYAFIIATFSQIWAVRKVVNEKLPAKQAFREGYNIARKKFWAMLLLGIVNTLLAMLISGIIAAPALITLVSGFISFEKNPTLGMIILGLGFFLLILFFMASGIVGGIITAFKDTVWSHAYAAIKGKYDK